MSIAKMPGSPRAASMKKVKRARKPISVEKKSEKNVVFGDRESDKMAKDQLNRKVELLMEQEKWEAARNLLESASEANPHSHWLLTQLAVTFYEERKYAEALTLLMHSLDLKDDCPLTLWNLAGTLDALGRYDEAQRVFVWIIQSKLRPKDDSCWESDEWATTLKADAVFRLADTERHKGNRELADRLYRKYLDLLLAGVKGSYSVNDVLEGIRRARDSEKVGTTKKKKTVISIKGVILKGVLSQATKSHSGAESLEPFLENNRAAWIELTGQSGRRVASARLKPAARSKG